jgi:hypothetical protein
MHWMILYSELGISHASLRTLAAHYAHSPSE